MRALVAVAVMALALVSAVGTARAASATTGTAEAVAKAIGNAGEGALVVASPLASDIPAPRGDELSLRLAQLVAGKIGGSARAHDRALSLAAARAAARGKKALVFLDVRLARGELRVTADAYPVVSNGWDRIRLPPPPPVAHGYAAQPIDAEIRALLPPIALEQATVHKAPHEEGDVLAVACGDADGDGALELVLVSREKVTLARLRAGKVAPLSSVPWSKLSPRVAVPLREPIAGAVIEGGRLRVATTDRRGVRLDATLAPVEPLRGIPAAGSVAGCASPDPEASALVGPLSACDGPTTDLATVFEPPAQRFDAAALADVTAQDGSTVRVGAVREPSGRVRVRIGKADVALVDGAGAQLAAADLDLDGTPEIATTLASGEDAILIHSVAPGTQARLRRKLPAPAGVRALAACPPEEQGVPALVAVVGGEVWLVR
jgi:hypothetical protein